MSSLRNKIVNKSQSENSVGRKVLLKDESGLVILLKNRSENKSVIKSRFGRKAPLAAAVILAIIIAGCIFSDLITTRDPSYMDLSKLDLAPCAGYIFGTDTMGRDIYSMIWYGGRISLFIGIVSALISTLIAVTIGALSGSASDRMDAVIMRITDIILSIPSLPLAIMLQAMMGAANVISLSVVIGATNWMNMAKLIRTEVRQLRDTEYVIAARNMGGGFFYVLFKHLAPNFIPSLMFMIVMSIRSAIASESTLSFLGMGLPLEQISWGSMLSLSEKALMTDSWWIIVIPGAFLAVTLLCFTSLGNSLRGELSKRHSQL